MNSGRIVIIGDDSEDTGRVFEKYLNTIGYTAECIRNDCDMIYNRVNTLSPDIVMLSVTLLENRIAELAERIKKNFPAVKIVVLTYVVSPKLCREITASGADRCVIMPISLHELGGLLADVMSDTYIFDFDPVIIDFLSEAGLRKNTSGFRYLCTAVGLCLLNPEYICDITKTLYVKIAALHDTKPELVERALRHLCESIHKSGADKRLLDSRIPHSADKRLTNAELIIGVTDVFADEYSVFKQ